MKEVQLGLPSPFFGEQRKGNPLAKNARFRVDDNVVVGMSKEMFVDGNKVVEISILAHNCQGIRSWVCRNYCQAREVNGDATHL